MNKRTLGGAAVFLVGCAVGGASSHLVVPKANAQQAGTMTRWEYYAPTSIDYDEWPTALKRAGAEGWELVTAQLDHGNVYASFKRATL